jgi:hypothetical protein
MARPGVKWFASSGLNNLRKRIRPFGSAVGQDGDPRVLVMLERDHRAQAAIVHAEKRPAMLPILWHEVSFLQQFGLRRRRGA